MSDGVEDLFSDFENLWITGPNGRWFARAGGKPDRKPLLLLHGFPQSHVMWHRLAPALARRRRVICLDIKGYGWSEVPWDRPEQSHYEKRVIAGEIVAVMERLGHVHFALAGHDRGARIGYRLALDQPSRVEKLALLDIVPTCSQWARIEADPNSYPHWRFLSRPPPGPEEAIARDPNGYFEGLMRDWTAAGNLSVFAETALHFYRQSWNVPERIHAMCEDYRAGGADGPDREADIADLQAGRTLQVPTLVLSSRDFLDKGRSERALDVWRHSFAPKAIGASIPGGHFLAEENPRETMQVLEAFLNE